MKPVLVVFVKAPIMGKAKTRLAAGIGKVHAQRAYRAMCARVFRAVRSPRWETILYVTPDNSAGKSYGGLWPGDLARVVQRRGGLTERSARIFTHKGPMIAIGTDSPQVRARDIAAGFNALKSNAAVFGPADDGGFWLIGLNGPARVDLFENVRWSNADTLADMQARIDGETAHLRMLTDVDDLAAYRKVVVGSVINV